jgi:hypothetical protein
VAELADAQDSKSCPRKRVWVQFPPSALKRDYMLIKIILIRRNILFAVLLCFACRGLADTFTNKKTGERFNGYAVKTTQTAKMAVRSTAREGIRYIERADYDIVYNAEGRRNQIFVIDMNEPLMLECETAAFEKAIKLSENQGNLAIVIKIDTPGGRIDLMKRYCTAIAAVDMTPVIAVVCGGKTGGAYSAGAIIAMGCDKLYMGENTAIGAATLLVIDANDEFKSAKAAYGDVIGEKVDSAHRAYCASVAEHAGRSGLLAQAMINKEIEVIARKTENGKYEILDGRDIKDSNTKDIIIVNHKGSLLTLSAKQAVDIGFADGQIDSFNIWKQNGPFTQSKWIVCQDIQAAHRQYLTYDSQFQTALMIIKQLKTKIHITPSKTEMRDYFGGIIEQYRLIIALKKNCNDLPVEMDSLVSELDQFVILYNKLSNQ